MQPSDRILVALDVDILESADWLIRSTAPHVGGFKTGKELMFAAGPQQTVQYVNERKGKTFMDGKFHDIPATVGKVCRVATRFRPFMFNVHTLGGLEMMHAAREAVDDEARKISEEQGLQIQKPLLVAVTILTSLDRVNLTMLGFDPDLSVTELVVMLAQHAKSAGLDGVVCSPQEIEPVRLECGDDFVIVAPGIRAKNAKADDQKRTATATEAIQWGATYLVIGRPITKADNPVDAAKRFADEVDAVKV